LLRCALYIKHPLQVAMRSKQKKKSGLRAARGSDA